MAATPMATDTKLVNEDQSKPADRSLYQLITGSLLCASTTTRPDTLSSVEVLSKFNASSTETHMTAAQSILKSLKGTMDYGIRIAKCDEQLIGFCDANWAETDENLYSTSANLFMASKGQ